MRSRTDLLLLERFGLFLGLWLVLTGASPPGVLPGVMAAAAATLVSRRLAPPEEHRLRLLRLLPILPRFALRSVAGGIDVARRALDPRMPLNPGWIVYPAKLPPGTPRVVLGGELSLIPGTLAAGEEGGRLLVHCLDVDQPVLQQVADEEQRLQEALGG